MMVRCISVVLRLQFGSISVTRWLHTGYTSVTRRLHIRYISEVSHRSSRAGFGSMTGSLPSPRFILMARVWLLFEQHRAVARPDSYGAFCGRRAMVRQISEVLFVISPSTPMSSRLLARSGSLIV